MLQLIVLGDGRTLPISFRAPTNPAPNPTTAIVYAPRTDGRSHRYMNARSFITPKVATYFPPSCLLFSPNSCLGIGEKRQSRAERRHPWCRSLSSTPGPAASLSAPDSASPSDARGPFTPPSPPPPSLPPSNAHSSHQEASPRRTPSWDMDS